MIIGHEQQWKLLKKIADSGRLSHAYLFSGQDKLGKRKLALEWILSIFKENLQQQYHPDLILIEPQKKEVQIPQIRELIWRLSLKPYSAPLKAAIIDKAHLMTREAQSCLLKTLEEPRGDTLLILITEHPKYLFPTILSRVQEVKFYPVKKEEIKNYLQKQGVSKEILEEISEFSLGRPGVAMELISDRKKIDFLEEKTEEIIKISNSKIATRFQYAKYLSQDPQILRENLDIWLNYFRKVLLSNLSSQKDFPGYSLLKLKKIIQLIQNTKFLISTTNVNPRLALEVLMLEI